MQTCSGVEDFIVLIGIRRDPVAALPVLHLSTHTDVGHTVDYPSIKNSSNPSFVAAAV